MRSRERLSGPKHCKPFSQKHSTIYYPAALQAFRAILGPPPRKGN